MAINSWEDAGQDWGNPNAQDARTVEALRNALLERLTCIATTSPPVYAYTPIQGWRGTGSISLSTGLPVANIADYFAGATYHHIAYTSYDSVNHLISRPSSELSGYSFYASKMAEDVEAMLITYFSNTPDAARPLTQPGYIDHNLIGADYSGKPNYYPPNSTWEQSYPGLRYPVYPLAQILKKLGQDKIFFNKYSTNNNAWAKQAYDIINEMRWFSRTNGDIHLNESASTCILGGSDGTTKGALAATYSTSGLYSQVEGYQTSAMGTYVLIENENENAYVNVLSNNGFSGTRDYTQLEWVESYYYGLRYNVSVSNWGSFTLNPIVFNPFPYSIEIDLYMFATQESANLGGNYYDFGLGLIKDGYKKVATLNIPVGEYRDVTLLSNHIVPLPPIYQDTRDENGTGYTYGRYGGIFRFECPIIKPDFKFKNW